MEMIQDMLCPQLDVTLTRAPNQINTSNYFNNICGKTLSAIRLVRAEILNEDSKKNIIPTNNKGLISENDTHQISPERQP